MLSRLGANAIVSGSFLSIAILLTAIVADNAAKQMADSTPVTAEGSLNAHTRSPRTTALPFGDPYWEVGIPTRIPGSGP